jgi:hypothetical protein
MFDVVPHKGLRQYSSREGFFMRRRKLWVLLVIVTIAPISIAQNADEQDIDRLFSDLKQTLIKRSAPDGLLSPSLTGAQRQKRI